MPRNFIPWWEGWGWGVRHQPRISHRNTPCSFFYKCILQAAIDFAERNSGVRGANGGAECRTFCGVAGFAPKPNF